MCSPERVTRACTTTGSDGWVLLLAILGTNESPDYVRPKAAAWAVTPCVPRMEPLTPRNTREDVFRPRALLCAPLASAVRRPMRTDYEKGLF